MSEEQRDSFVYYRSFRNALNYLDDAQYRELNEMILDRALDRSAVKTSDKLIEVFYKMIEPNIDANYRKAISGKKGGRPAKKGKPEVKKEITIGLEENNHRLKNNKANVDVDVDVDVDGTLPRENKLRSMVIDGENIDIDTGEVCPFGKETN